MVMKETRLDVICGVNASLFNVTNGKLQMFCPGALLLERGVNGPLTPRFCGPHGPLLDV